MGQDVGDARLAPVRAVTFFRRSLPTRLEGEGTRIRALRAEDAQALLELRLRNRAFLTPWDPDRPAAFFTLAGQRAVLAEHRDAWRDGRRFAFAICAGDDVPLGSVTLDNVVRGAMQGATLGYWLDEASGGRGHATEAVRLTLRFAFDHVGLHRVQAAVMPRNPRSARVLAKAGFRHEGRALRYLRIAGAWEDHDLFAVTAEEREGRGA
jgi:ribosomal-protein-alanine N-acetyltransferase